MPPWTVAKAIAEGTIALERLLWDPLKTEAATGAAPSVGSGGE